MKINRKDLFTKPIFVTLLAIFCCLLWGSAAPLIKTGYSLFNIAKNDTGTQLIFAGTRFALAGLLTIIVFSIINKKILFPSRGNYLHVLELGMVQTVIQYFFFYIGLANTSGVKCSIIQGANAFIALLIASIIFRMEKLTFYKIIGCVIGFSGVIIINLIGNTMDLNFRLNGEGAILLSMTAYAFSSILIKMFSKTERTYILCGYQFFIGGIVLIILGTLMGGHLSGFNFSSTALLAYLAALSAVAYTLWGTLLKYNSVGKVTVFSFVTPIFGVILSAIILGESKQAFGIVGVISLGLICLGIYIVNRTSD